MSEYNKGDLIEAIKGERVVRDRVQVHDGDVYISGVPLLWSSYDGINHAVKEGYTITVMERAPFRVKVPTPLDARIRNSRTDVHPTSPITETPTHTTPLDVVRQVEKVKANHGPTLNH